MGYEYLLQIPASQRLLAGDNVLRRFEVRVPFALKVVERQAATGSYAFGKTTREQWAEDFTISVDEQKCYVVFHVASSHQPIVLNILMSCLLEAGITGTFDEL